MTEYAGGIVPFSKAYRWYVVGLLLVTSIFGYLDRLIMGLLLEPIKLEMQFTDTQMGILNGLAFALFYIVMGVPIGRLVDTRNRAKVLAACVMLWSAACMSCGLAMSYFTLFLARVGVGIGEAGLNPSAISLISDYFDEKEVARPLSVFTLGIYVGGGLAILLGGAIIAWALTLPPLIGPFGFKLNDWRLVFVVAGAPGILLALLLWRSIREPREAGLISKAHETKLSDMWAFLRTHAKAFALVYGSLIAFGFNVYAVLGWYPAMMIRTFEVDAQDVATGYGLAYLIGGTAGALLTAPLVSRLDAAGVKAPAVVLSALAMVILMIASLAAPLMPSLTSAMMMSGIVLFGWAMVITTAFVIIANVTPAELRGTMVGFYLVLMNATGGALGTVLVGWFTDNIVGPEKLDTALVIVAGIAMPPAIILMLAARKSVARMALQS